MSKVVYVCTSAEGVVTEVTTLAEARALKERNGGNYVVKYVPFQAKEQ